MERNVLGLPSFTGFTPLKARARGQVLKYDFKGLGPRVIDKSINGNGGMLEPRWPTNSPKRKTVSTFPLEMVLVFDGEDDYVRIPNKPSLNFGKEEDISVRINIRTPPRETGSAIFFKANSQDEKGWWVNLDGGGRVEFGIHDGDNIFYMETSPINDDERHDFLGIIDRDNRENCHTYVDGELDEARKEGRVREIGDIDNNLNASLGATSNGKRNFYAEIKRVELYSTVVGR